MSIKSQCHNTEHKLDECPLLADVSWLSRLSESWATETSPRLCLPVFHFSQSFHLSICLGFWICFPWVHVSAQPHKLVLCISVTILPISIWGFALVDNIFVISLRSRSGVRGWQAGYWLRMPTSGHPWSGQLLTSQWQGFLDVGLLRIRTVLKRQACGWEKEKPYPGISAFRFRK